MLGLERLIKNRILYFRNNISIADSISETIEIINDNLESLHKYAIISKDIRKAFDTLAHTILLNKFIYMELEVQL